MKKLFLFLGLLWYGNLSAQIDFSANDIVPPYEATFGYGTNLGIYSGWNDIDLANIAAGNEDLNIPGVGCNTMRPFLPEFFLEAWGYHIRLLEFQHYESLGMHDHTAFIGYPSNAHRDPNSYCPGVQSPLFANLYLDIWDNGENGTPVNDDNYYALYLYQMVNVYKDYVTFWEVWNEPDFDYSASGFLPPGTPGNWWENVPSPCDYQLGAPIYHYIRMLRISYEVIKTLDPEAYIAVGGIGIPSFLDLILRHTDNPVDGSVSADFPLGGGAYFDVLSFHYYPHFDGSLRYWSNDVGGFVYTRHSDAAAEGIATSKQRFQNVLDVYGYDGFTFPEKEWIITESNLPSESFTPEYLGSEEAQRNYMIKAAVECQRESISQLHIFKIAEDAPPGQAVYEFQRMGFYQDLSISPPYNPVVNESGIANKTMADAIGDAHYHAAQTAALQLPAEAGGAAFEQADGSFTYVLWAKTQTDNTETASATYTFPANFNLATVEQRNWDYSQTGTSSLLNASMIPLDGAPVFLFPQENQQVLPTAAFEANTTFVCSPGAVQFTNLSLEATSWVWNFPGGTPSTSTEQHPHVVYNTPGQYSVSLLASNAAGNDQSVISGYISVGASPSANFNYSVNGFTVNFSNTATNNPNGYFWTFGDGMTSNAPNPSHLYTSEGTYTVTLQVENACGTNTINQEVTILSTPTAAINYSVSGNCAPFMVNYQNNSSSNTTQLQWLFPGGNPSNSILANPVIHYSQSGDYTATLIASNDSGSDTTSLMISINEVLLPPTTITASICEGQVYTYNDQDYSVAGTYPFEFTSSEGCDSTVFLELAVDTLPPTYLYEEICEGQVYTYNGQGYSVAGTYPFEFISSEGCDSTVFLELTVDTLAYTHLYEEICEGQVYTYNGQGYSVAGTYPFEFTSSEGCDSTVLLHLEVDTIPTTNTFVELCSGDYFAGQRIENDTAIQNTYTTALGCDSLVITNITAHNTFQVFLQDTILSGESYSVGNSVYTTTGNYVDTLLSQEACDSIIFLNLQVDIVDGLEEANSIATIQAYPNPFSSSINLQIELSRNQKVKIVLYDILGRPIKDVLNTQLLFAGTHQFAISGEDLANGVYFCRVIAWSASGNQKNVPHEKMDILIFHQ